MAVGVYALGRWVADLRGLVGVAAFLVLLLADYTFTDARDHDVSDVVFVLALVAPPYILGRIARRLADQKELLRGTAGADPRARRCAPSATASPATCTTSSPTPSAPWSSRRQPRRTSCTTTPTAPSACWPTSPTPGVGRSPRPVGCCTCCATTPTSWASNRLRGSPTWPAWWTAFRAERARRSICEVPETLPRLPAGVDVSAYRIVQEALTNALQVRRRPDGAAARRRDRRASAASTATNPTAAGAGRGAGLGLVGMAERVVLLGGQLTHGVARRPVRARGHPAGGARMTARQGRGRRRPGPGPFRAADGARGPRARGRRRGRRRREAVEVVRRTGPTWC